MPNYVAHEFFGQQVRERLPQELCRAIERDGEAYRCGLYGPDPLLFLPGGGPHSKTLHKRWQEDTAPILQNMLEWGTEGEKSFAAGYLCHLLLDDCCHALIYRWMEEQGLSHRCLEVGLDWLILKQLGEDRFPVPYVEERRRISELAADILYPVKPREYRMGLASMGTLCRQMNVVGKLYRKKMKGSYREPIGELLRLLEETADSAVMLITLFASGEMQPVGAQPLPAPAY